MSNRVFATLARKDSAKTAFERFLGRLGQASLLMLGAMSFGIPAHAATVNDGITVSANVQATCSITANDLAFGTYDPLSLTAVDASTTIDIACTGSLPYIVSINAGLGSGATVGTRKMTSGGNTLNYSLYQDTLRALVWGVTGGTDTVAGIGNAVTQTLGLYGRIPAGQLSPFGSYSDTVTVVVTY